MNSGVKERACVGASIAASFSLLGGAIWAVFTAFDTLERRIERAEDRGNLRVDRLDARLDGMSDGCRGDVDG